MAFACYCNVVIPILFVFNLLQSSAYLLSEKACLLTRDVTFMLSVQIGAKLDKSGTFSDRISQHFRSPSHSECLRCKSLIKRTTRTHVLRQFIDI